MNTQELTILIGEMRSLVDQIAERADRIRDEFVIGEPTFAVLNQIQAGETNSTEEVVNVIKQDIRDHIQDSGSVNAMFRGEIIDIYEDFCDKNGIEITNPAKDEYDRESGFAPGENGAKLFGSDYDAIAETAVSAVLEKRPSVTVAKFTTNAFADIVASRGSRPITVNERKDLCHSVWMLLNNWCLLDEKEVA